MEKTTKYAEPEINVIRLTEEDIITGSPNYLEDIQGEIVTNP